MLTLFPGRRRVVALAAVIVLPLLAATGAAGPVHSAADQISDKQQQRAQLNLTMGNLQHQIATAQNQQAALQKIIDGINASIATTSGLVNAAQIRLAQTTAALSVAEDRLAETRARLARDRDQLQKAMVLTFKFDKDYTALASLVSSGDFNEFFVHLLAARKVSAAEGNTVSAVTAERQAVQEQVATVAAQKQEQAKALAGLREQVTELDGELASQQNAEALLRQVQANDQQQLLLAQQSARQVDNEIAQLKAARARAEAEARAAAAAAAAARNRGGPPINANARFSWPESGPIAQGYGCTGYPFEPPPPAGIYCSSGHFHTGIDIAAPGGTAVRAADGGVAFTFPGSYGYGNHVIIVHAGGWTSVYGHLASFAVRNGVSVGRGQVIGYEGSTGNSTGPHLHFEIRLNDSVENPFNYLP